MTIEFRVVVVAGIRAILIAQQLTLQEALSIREGVARKVAVRPRLDINASTRVGLAVLS